MNGEEERLAVDLLFRAIQVPICQIAENAGEEGEVVLERVKGQAFGFGWNAATGKYEDLLKSGVIDPALVTQQCILNSCSIAAAVITTGALITEVKEKPGPGAGGSVDGMGGGDYM
jgi:chaperonin GroEL